MRKTNEYTQTLKAKEEILWAALRTRSSVKARYDGLARIFCPHKIGYKQDSLRVLACQHGGETSKGPVRPDAPEWKCLDIAGLKNLHAAPGGWHPRGTADPHVARSTCMDPERTKVVALGNGTLEGTEAVRHELKGERERIRSNKNKREIGRKDTGNPRPK